MLIIGEDGCVCDGRVRNRINKDIERDWIPVINGIIVQQTACPSISVTSGKNRRWWSSSAHFHIDENGTIYQTESIFRRTRQMAKSRSECYASHSCSPVDTSRIVAAAGNPSGRLQKLSKTGYRAKLGTVEANSCNRDAIGIEVAVAVAGPDGREVFRPVNPSQQISVRWLVSELLATLGVSSRRDYGHAALMH